MTVKIRQLSQKKVPDSSDLLLLYTSDDVNHPDRASLSAYSDFVDAALTYAHQESTPKSGDTVQLQRAERLWYTALHQGTIAAMTIKFPALPINDMQRVELSFNGDITTLAVNFNGADSYAGGSFNIGVSAGDCINFMYDATSAKWYRARC